MSKNSFPEHKLLSKTNLAIFFALAMFAGFLGARIVASISIIIFGFNAIRDVHPKKWFTQKWWLLGVLWIGMYALSWFWTDNKHEWGVLFQVKLPILLLPLGFGFLPGFSRKQLDVYSVGLCVLLLSGIGYSLALFIRDSQSIIHSYAFSGTLRTPAGNDHISFSASVTFVFIWCARYFKKTETSWIKWLLAITMIVAVVYLHILAVKTGLIALYLALFFWSAYLVASSKPVLGLVIIVVIAGAYFVGKEYVPTFRNKIGYVQYSIEKYRNKDRTGNYSDIGRVLSYDLAWKLIEEEPLTGVGSGDVLAEMGKQYKQHYPDVTKEQELLPHNQFLMVGTACGLIALVVFAIWVFAPLARIRRNRDGFFLFITWFTAFFLLFVDPILEVQYGVYVFLFFLLWMRHEVMVGAKGE